MSANDKNLELNINTTRGNRLFSFLKQTKIEEVIRQIVTAFGFAGGDTFQLVLASNPTEALQPERPLVSYHLTDGTTLILTAVGSGV
jgi:hypothetical protein